MTIPNASGESDNTAGTGSAAASAAPETAPVSAPPAGSPTVSAPGTTTASDVAVEARAQTARSTGHPWLGAALAFVVVLAICLIAYLLVAIPARWFPGVPTLAWTARDLSVAKGTGRVVGGELVVSAPDAAETTLVSVVTDFRSADYPGIAWIVIDLPERATAQLIWRNDYTPDRIHSVALRVESGRVLPVVLNQESQWIGRIKGLALAVRGPLAQPIRMRGVVAKPMGALDVLGDRAREWLAFEGWTGTSINTITGGADIQELPLPLLLAVAIGLSSLLAVIVRRLRPGSVVLRPSAVLVALFLFAWIVLDARWMWNLARQAQATISEFAGKTWREKRLGADDGPLFEFIERAREVLPKTPARVFVVADAHYFRGRAAYHLYPHSVFYHPTSNVMPAASTLRPGDWLLVYQRKGVQYDAERKSLRWDDNQTASADLKLVGKGAALLQIR